MTINVGAELKEITGFDELGYLGGNRVEILSGEPYEITVNNGRVLAVKTRSHGLLTLTHLPSTILISSERLMEEIRLNIEGVGSVTISGYERQVGQIALNELAEV